MATTIDTGLQLRFAIELEPVLKAKADQLAELEAHGYKDVHKKPVVILQNRKAIMKYFQEKLNAAELLCQIRTGSTNKDYTVWGIEHDSSLKPSHGCYGVEIVSPVLFEGWQTKLTSVFDLINRAFTIVQDNSAGTYVHVAPLGRSWTLDEIRQISKGVVAWAAPMEDLMRRDRGTYAVWNDWDGSFDALALQDLVNNISPTWYCAWNFRLLLDARGTVEFRRPYQTLGLRPAQHWVVATLCLFAYFLRKGGLNVPSDLKEARQKLAAEEAKLGFKGLLDHNYF